MRRMPPIAPLNRREARVARDLLTQFRRTLDEHTVPPDDLSFMASVISRLEAAVADYDARTWLGRRFPPINEHRLRLRSWMLELRAVALQELEEG